MKRSSEGPLAECSLLALAIALFAFGFGSEVGSHTGFDSEARGEGDLRVLTWNVGGHEGRDGHALAEEWIPHVVRTLQALNPELAFLQEVGGREQAEQMLRELGPGWTLFAESRLSARRVIALAQRGTLSALRDGARDRRAQSVVYESETGLRVAAVGLHASAYSAADRNAQVGEAVRRLTASRQPIQVLAGDLNLDLALDSRGDLFSNDEYLDVETYNFATERLIDTALGGGSTAEPDRRLDYILVAGRQTRSAGPVRGYRRGDMDHDPVVADLR